MNATWDMYTSGENAGSVIRPLRYTETPDDAIRVIVWCQIATPLGKYRLRLGEGLDHERMLSPDASDEERGAYVRDLVLGVPGVIAVVDGPDITLGDDPVANSTLDITVTFRTASGAVITVGA